MALPLLAAVGTSLLGGAVSTLATAKQRKQAKRAQKLLDTKYKDTRATQGVAQGIRQQFNRQQTSDTTKFMDEMARLESSGVNPTLLNQRRQAHMAARAEAAALTGAQAERADRSALAAKRGELMEKADVPTAGERFMQGMGVAAPFASAAAESVGSMPRKQQSVDTPDQINNLANSMEDLPEED